MSGALASSQPVRYPDSGSRPVMTRRAWVLVVLNIVIPGSAQMIAGSRRLGRFGVGATFVLWALVIAAGLTFLLALHLQRPGQRQRACVAPSLQKTRQAFQGLGLIGFEGEGGHGCPLMSGLIGSNWHNPKRLEEKNSL